MLSSNPLHFLKFSSIKKDLQYQQGKHIYSLLLLLLLLLLFLLLLLLIIIIIIIIAIIITIITIIIIVYRNTWLGNKRLLILLLT